MSRDRATANGKSSARQAIGTLCMLVPWLFPFASGPSASVEPWLASFASVLLLAVVFPPMPSRGVVLAALLFAACSIPRAPVLEGAALAGAMVLVGLAAACANPRRSEVVEAIAWAWCVAALASTAIGLLQYFGAEAAFSPWVSNSELGQAYGNLRQRNQFATLTAIGLAALAWRCSAAPLRWSVVLAVILGIGNGASVSRTGLVALLALLVLAAAWPGERRRRLGIVGAAAAGYVVAALVLPLLLAAVSGVEGTSLWHRVSSAQACSSRAILWRNVLELIAQRPLAGWGWGELDYAHYATLYPGERFCDILDNAHNLPLHLAVELGIPVAIMLLVLAAACVVRARPWSERDGTRQLAWAVLALLALHSLVEYPLWYGPFQLALGLALGLLWPARERPVTIGGRLAWGLALAALSGFTAYAAWDYRSVSQVYTPPEARWDGYGENPIAAARGTWLFRAHLDFAELTLAPLTADNAAWTLERAQAMLHYSPEPRVVEKVVDSALLLHRDDLVAFHAARWKAAFPSAYKEWLSGRAASQPR